MRYLIFSDTHLSADFDQKLFDYLHRIIVNADKVIIAGDFWDGYLTSAEEFVASPWSQLFPLLLERKTFYIWGNSDTADYNQGLWTNFAVASGSEFRFNSLDKEFIVQHGHLQSKSNREKLPRFTERSRLIGKLKMLIELIDTKLFAHKLLHILRYKSRRQIKASVQPQPNQIFVFGHAHVAEDDRDNGFMLLDSNHYGHGSYLLIDDQQNSMQLVNASY